MRVKCISPKQKKNKPESHLLTSDMLGFANDTALLDGRLAVFSWARLVRGFVRKADKKLEKKGEKTTFRLAVFLFGYAAVHLNHVVSLVFL